jgi:4-amino-4-deoxy-L-arabinose transferase-like glycosyltransferase
MADPNSENRGRGAVESPDQPALCVNGRLTRGDLCLLTAYSTIVFGIAIVSGRPLSLHEAVLPQTARAMLADHDFVVPKMDAKRPGTVEATMPPAPWLENPPLPQWCTVAVASLFGRCDSEAIVRIGPTLVSIGAVLAVAWMAALWFGRGIGVLSGLAMATTLEFTRYAWSSEDEIYLCAVMAAVMALFVKNEFGLANEGWTSRSTTPQPRLTLRHVLFGGRSWWLLAFFCALGVTNLVKGLLFGAVMAGAPIAVFLLATRDFRRIVKYAWVWGILAYTVIMFAWPLAIYARYPDVTDLWFFDLGGRVSGNYTVTNAPLWYYPVNLLWMCAPWTVLVPFGLWATAKRCWNEPTSPERFLWCCAFIVPIVFSIPGGKHHHYLLHALSPWAILGILGARELRRIVPTLPQVFGRPSLSLLTVGLPAVVVLLIFHSKIPGPSWLPYALMVAAPLVAYLATWGTLDSNARRGAAVVFTLLLVAYCGTHLYSAEYVDRYRDDVVFLKAVRDRADREQLPVCVDMGTHPFHGMLGLFYQRDSATLLHDLSFLDAAEIRSPEILLISLSFEQEHLQHWGTVEMLDQSPTADRGVPQHGKLTLYRLKFKPDILRVAVHDLRISPLQAMHRRPGPEVPKNLTVDASSASRKGNVTPVGYHETDERAAR